ncbi:glycosyltransferase [Marinihelvus fidelis]|uniref:Glycosyltransferase n=1 Tax=Marinihelvus fidelis TaxID=2613842 RepID=A0A5N0T7B4_9GAMM|nr:glycosyltransferase [Marinihelvus fidelis]KAA9130935.1 glycosyltransferase [Marinihelvus fidelis]
MKVSGFSFIRDGIRLGYPFVESIRSALPVCDEFVVAVGRGDDGTLQCLRDMNEPKLRLVETTWNEACRSHGFVYGQQKMIAQYNCTGDWAFYLEGDEVLHEDDTARLRAAMAHYLDDREVEALAFDYIHFYGDAGHVHHASQAYRKACRIIRNSIRTIAPDGLYWAVIRDRTWHGGRNKRRTRYPRAAALNIPIYHYGNARHARYVQAKADIGNQYWSEKQAFGAGYGRIDPQQISVFEGEHPAIMSDWLDAHANPSFEFDPDHRLTSRERKHRWLARLEAITGRDFSKRHFQLIRSWDGQPGA